MEDELTRFIRESIKKNEEEAKEMLAKKKQEKIEKLISESGLGKRFRAKTFENFNVNDVNRNAYKIALEFAKNFSTEQRGLLISGPVGIGKTHLAAAIANQLIKNLYTVIFGNVTDIVSIIKKTYKTDSENSELDIIDMLTHVDLLIIDDIGKENPTPNTCTILYQIINRLYEDNRPIIVTTNFNGQEIAKRLGDKGDAIASRLKEMCETIKMNGQDWRLKY